MLFRSCDERALGYVTVDEFRVFLKRARLGLTSAQADRIAYMCDEKMSGLITRDMYNEILSVYGLNQE